jgi:hypothetical protein
MWQAVQDQPLTHEQFKRISEMFEARRTARTTENFTRKWQSEPAQGARSVKDVLKLDERPVVLLATNVLGDSLTLGRQVFSRTMAEWVSRTILYFIGRPDVQLVIRIHPGEVLSRERLMQNVSHRSWDPGDRTIDVLISRLRDKLEEDPKKPKLIVTVRSEGYVLMNEVSSV